MQLKRIAICVALAFAPGAFAAETLPEVPVRSEALQPLPSTNNRGLEPESLKASAPEPATQLVCSKMSRA